MSPKKSNIVVFSFAYDPFVGGSEIAIKEIIRQAENFDFTVLTSRFEPTTPPVDKYGNVDIRRLGPPSRVRHGAIFKKIGYVFRAWQEAERLHSQRRFDLIWVVMASYGGIAALLFKMNHPNVPMLLTIQEGDSESHLKYGKFGLVGFFGKLMFRSADYIQVISGYLRDFSLMQGAQVPIEIVPNGVDIGLFSTKYRPVEIKALREYLGIKDEYVALTTSRLVVKNGVDILIRAVAKFKERRPNIKCLIIGEGPDRIKLERLAKKLGVESNVIFLGHMSQNDLPLYFAISDMFIRPSRSEGLGSSFLEAMAAGTPVIGTPVGGIVDFLKDGETGYVAEPENPESVAYKMHEILDDSKKTGKTVRQAKDLIHRGYSWETVGKMMRNIFDKLINL